MEGLCWGRSRPATETHDPCSGLVWSGLVCPPLLPSTLLCSRNHPVLLCSIDSKLKLLSPSATQKEASRFLAIDVPGACSLCCLSWIMVSFCSPMTTYARHLQEIVQRHEGNFAQAGFQIEAFDRSGWYVCV